MAIDDIRHLTHGDRCDSRSCGAQAYVRTVDPRTLCDLLWCRHHYIEAEWAIVEAEFIVYDETESLFAVAKLDVSPK